MLQRTLTVLSLICLLLSVGLWGASYFSFRMWWGESNVHLVVGRLYWSQAMLPGTPFAWRCEGFHGFYFKGLKPSPPEDWGFRRAPPAGQISYGQFLPNVALPGLSISWHRSYDANGVMAWRYSAMILLWAPTLVFGISLCLCRPLHHSRRRKRKKLGLCLKCGYDLRGSTDCCPECGLLFGELGKRRPHNPPVLLRPTVDRR